MTGPVGMCLGGFTFESYGFSYESVGRQINTPWVDIPVAQGFNQQQWTGPTSIEWTIRGVLFPVEFGGMAQLEGVIAAAVAGQPLMLVSGGMAQGLTYGLHTIQSTDDDQTFHTAFGVPRRDAYSIKLKRYGQALTGGAIAQVQSLFG